MSKPISELKREARQIATSHGHFLTPFSKTGTKLIAVCKRCQKKVEIDNGESHGDVLAGRCD